MRAFLCIRSKNSQTMNMGLTHAQRLARWHNSGMNKSLSMGQRAFKGALESISDIVAFALGKKKESAIKQKLFFFQNKQKRSFISRHSRWQMYTIVGIENTRLTVGQVSIVDFSERDLPYYLSYIWCVYKYYMHCM